MVKAEHISDEDLLYHRLHNNFFRGKKEIPPGAIKNTGTCNPPGMSTDWSKYSTPTETRNRGKQPPENYQVIRMVVGEVRKIQEQSVEHTPSKNNFAHTTVYGPKDANHAEIRVKFTRVAKLLSDDEY